MIGLKIRSILMLGLLLTVISCGQAASPPTTGILSAITETPPVFTSTTPSNPIPMSNPTSSPQPTTQNNQAITFATVIQGAQSGGQGELPSLQFVRSDKQRALLTTQISDEHIAAVNSVDLSTNMLIAAFQGLKPTSGYEIKITTINAANNVLSITANLISPPPEAPVRQGFETPYHIVQIPVDQFDAIHSVRYQLLDATGTVLSEGTIPNDNE